MFAPVDFIASVVMEEVIGFPVCEKTNKMPLLLQIMSKVNASGRVPKSFSANDK
jgi:hypothetical protein